MLRPKHAALLLIFFFLDAGFCCSATHPQQRCSVEVKLLLAPIKTQPANSTLNFKKETVGLVYFFDTDSLDLLSKGVILRLRQGADSDFTIKLRPPKGKNFFGTSGENERFKCEEDFTGDGAQLSYSIRRKYTAERLPETGGDLALLLSQRQKQLLQEAHVPIDWPRVKRIVEIKSTTWESQAQANARTLALEAWEWSDGQLLEISTRVKSDDGPRTYAELRKLATANGLSLSPIQGFKTSIVLESVTHARAK
jgi:hypothetical protein